MNISISWRLRLFPVIVFFGYAKLRPVRCNSTAMDFLGSESFKKAKVERRKQEGREGQMRSCSWLFRTSALKLLRRAESEGGIMCSLKKLDA